MAVDSVGAGLKVAEFALTSMMVCGAGHSGSTLLGMILGSHPDAFYMGEGGKVRYLHDEKKPLRKRVCKICGEACPVWSRFRWDAAQPLHAAVSAHTGASIIVDTTKDEEWIRDRAAETRTAGGRPVLIFLTRDGRAVVNSRIRKYPERDPADQIRQWSDKIATSRQLFDAFDGDKIEIRYEELAVETERVIRRVCRTAGITFHPSMLDYTATDHHVLGGNSGTQFLLAKARLDNPEQAFVSLSDRTRDYYGQHSGRIDLDLRWQEEMSTAHLALFDRLAGTINEPIKWEA